MFQSFGLMVWLWAIDLVLAANDKDQVLGRMEDSDLLLRHAAASLSASAKQPNHANQFLKPLKPASILEHQGSTSPSVSSCLGKQGASLLSATQTLQVRDINPHIDAVLANQPVSSSVRQRNYDRAYKLAQNDSIFEKIYETGVWGGDGVTKSYSGSGSSIRETQILCKILFQSVISMAATGNKVIRLLDAPQGDFFWMPHCLEKVDKALPKDTVVKYQGVDVADLAVKMAEKNRAAVQEKLQQVTIAPFLHVDLAQKDAMRNLENFNIVLCNDALMHNSHTNIKNILRNFNKVSTSDALFISNSYIGGPKNKDIKTGGYRQLDLTSEPYSFSPLCADSAASDLGEYITIHKLPLSIAAE